VNQDGTGYGGYTYDAWGNPLSVPNNEVAQNNPLRYRGYVWDKDTGLYYLQSRYYNPEWGRFINADALISTGQGILGNNMFAYCNNNPVNGFDHSGHAFHTLDSKLIGIGSLHGIVDAGGGGGISGCGGESGRQKSLKVIQREIAYYNNTNEQVVLESEFISFYHGVPVFRANFGIGGGLSFGIIVLDDDYKYNNTGINTLKHEYGHRLHMEDIGVVNYTFTTAIPSLIGAALSNAEIINVDYYSLPWEYVADRYGNVTRNTYTGWAHKAGMHFGRYTLLVSEMTGGI
jgi:RHS repeat-associated protein